MGASVCHTTFLDVGLHHVDYREAYNYSDLVSNNGRGCAVLLTVVTTFFNLLTEIDFQAVMLTSKIEFKKKVYNNTEQPPCANQSYRA